MSFESYAKYLQKKFNGNIELAKQIILNNAIIAADSGNEFRLEIFAKIFHCLKKIQKKTNHTSKSKLQTQQ
ncbi:MAG: hypothetical protein JXR51_07660 [Bacteroidales bacterium]|nr:hypothetical protein [Bacteroidales bacterium]MBN2757035.1 hypothetical protein [Bacteroidales bacterium]